MDKIQIDPFDRFFEWYIPVISGNVENSNAVILSTSTKTGKVSSRVVLLKNYDRGGFVFFTNYNSRKGVQLNENYSASMLFYWPDSKRQIRIEGQVERTSSAESDSYFDSREKGKKINAIVSNQSEPVANISVYNKKILSALDFYKDSEPERPSHWGGFRLVPERFEFWEEGENRFHHRVEYLYAGEGWEHRTLYP